jgi:hypothetical protein
VVTVSWKKLYREGVLPMKDLFEKLEYAKNAVRSTLEDANCSVDFHGLSYWAGEVERLREEIKKML